MRNSNRKLLLASIHDVGPAFDREVDALAELLGRKLGGPNFAMLVVPDHWGEIPLLPGTPFARRLRGWAEQGVEMLVHGWYHKDMARHAGLAGFKARYLTAGEAEFLGLGRKEAALRMIAGRKLVEDITGKAAAGFVARRGCMEIGGSHHHSGEPEVVFRTCIPSIATRSLR